MASAFETLSPANAKEIRAKFLAGHKMVDLRKEYSIDAKKMRELRDEVFEPLLTDPQAVKDLANGPMFNPGAMVKLPYARAVQVRLRQRANADALSDTDKEYIRRQRAEPARKSVGALADEFDVHPNTIRAIVKAM